MTSDGGLVTCGSCGEQWTTDASDGGTTCPQCGTIFAGPPADDSTEPVTAFPGLPGDEIVGESAITAFSTAEQPESTVLDATASDAAPSSPPGIPSPSTDATIAESPSAITRGFLNWAASHETGEQALPDSPPHVAADDTTQEQAIGDLPAFMVQVATGLTEPETPLLPEVPAVVVSSESATAHSAPPAVIAPPIETVRRPDSDGSVPRHLFVLLAGYASAVTIALIWLWFSPGRNHPLESLPDIIPKHDAEGKTAYPFPRDDDELPYGHTLKIGETRRFGHLEITPLRVTRGPLRLAAAVAGSDDSAVDDGVFKMWLRIRNVSDDQTFMPFGRELLQLRSRDKRVNTFVARNDARTKTRVPMWNFQLDAEGYALKNQQLNRRLGPGEEYDTYLASDDGVQSLTGQLVWRVHFRKGYNPKSKRGVTTLIEVLFHRDDVTQESLGG